jgi:protease II
LLGGAGADFFTHRGGSGGIDTVLDFNPGAAGDDYLRLQNTAFASAADVIASAVESGGNTVIYTGVGSAVILQGVLKSQLDIGDIILG